MENFRASANSAHAGYRDLLEKFPRSTSVLRSYASFCDVVLNKNVEALQLRQRAELYESSNFEDGLDDLVSDNGMLIHVKVDLLSWHSYDESTFGIFDKVSFSQPFIFRPHDR